MPARYHAYAVDQRSHGDSERPACCYAIDDLAADIVAFLDGVEVERATLVGHSASGFIARRVAETYLFERLVAQSLKAPARVWQAAYEPQRIRPAGAIATCSRCSCEWGSSVECGSDQQRYGRWNGQVNEGVGDAGCVG